MKRKIIALCVVVAMLAVAIVGSTMAYFTDTDQAVNVMTIGNVKIEQFEQERDASGALVAFTQMKPLYPAVYPGNSTTDSIPWDDAANWPVPNDIAWRTVEENANVIDKFVTVKNTGKSDAYVRTIIAFEGDAINGTNIHIVCNGSSSVDTGVTYKFIENVIINDVRYDVIVFTYNEPLAAGETSVPSLKQIYLDHTCGNEDVEAYGETYDVLVVTQAIQAKGFEPDGAVTISDDAARYATAALDTGFGEVTPAKAAEWLGSMRIPKPPVEVNSETPREEIIAMLTSGQDIMVTESIELADITASKTTINFTEDVIIYAAKDAEISFSKTTLLTGTGTITVHGGKLVTPQELCTTGNATLVIEDGEHTFGAFSATSNGSIIVNGGTLNCMGTYAGVMGISFGETGSLTVNGGKLNMYQPFNLNANRCDAVYIEINGGTVELLGGIENLFVARNIMDKDNESGVLRGSSIKITGGEFIAHYEIDSAGDATSFIRNGDYPSDTNKVLVSNTFNGNPDYNCVVTGGTFYGSWQRADNTRYTDGNGAYSDGLMVENSIAGFVADGYQITGDATNGYVVSAKSN